MDMKECLDKYSALVDTCIKELTEYLGGEEVVESIQFPAINALQIQIFERIPYSKLDELDELGFELDSMEVNNTCSTCQDGGAEWRKIYNYSFRLDVKGYSYGYS